MDRRDFLKVAAAAPVVAAIPFPFEARPALTVDMIKNAISDVWALAPQGPYYMVISPYAEFWMRRMRALEAWKAEYGTWRKLRNEPLEAVMRRVKGKLEQRHEWIVSELV